jgi:hypothetical protein
MIKKLTASALCVVLLLVNSGSAQNPASLETAPAIPVDESAIASTAAPETTAAAVASPVTETGSEKPIEDYTTQIGTGLKERERRLTLLNEAMMKLREAGEMEDAARVEERIRSLLAMPAPSQVNAQLKGELDQLRARNDELIVQMVAMEEELKRYRGPGGSSLATRKR